MKSLYFFAMIAMLVQFSKGKDSFAENVTLEVSPRIVRGREAEGGMFPFMVAIYRFGSYICSGFIISNTIILSAAHCFYREGSLEDVSFFYAVAGNVNRSGEGVTLRFKSILLHPKYRPRRENFFPYENDLALLESHADIPFTKEIKQICIAAANSRYTRYKSATAIGWGSTQGNGKNELPGVVNYSELKILPPMFCPSVGLGDRSKICAFTPHNGICQGDSGGALVHLGSEPVAIGIASHIHSGRGCGRIPSLSVFTRIASYNSFIKEHSENICEL